MSTQPIDYSALAKQAGAISSAPPQVDYSALAKQAGAVSSTPASGPAPKPDTRSFTDKALEFISKPAEYFTDHTINAMDAAKSGQYAKAANEGIKAGSLIAAPLLPESIAAAPLTAARVVAGGYLANKAGQAVASGAGATPDQAELAGNVTGLIGGAGAGTGAIRAFLETPAKAALGKVASAADGVVSDDVLGMISPRALHGLKMLRAAAKVAGSTEDSAGLSELAAKHTDAISATEQTLNDALSKANALPPESPTAKAIDVPDLRVQPAQQAPQNLMEAHKSAFQRAQTQAQGGTFQVTPPESATPAAPAAASNTPKGAMYDEPIQEKTAQQIFQGMPKKPPSLIDQLKQWDNIRQIHAQLEDQIGKGQDEIQSWMDEHHQEAPGAKPTGAAATAKARFDAARAAAESKANAIETDAPQGGHAGNGVSSVEELSRPGKNYVVTKSGALTYQGKSFAPESTPNGASHVTVLPDGSFRVNAGPQLNPSQTAALKASQPRVPTSDEDVESLLMKSIQNAQAKRSAKASD